MSDEQTNDLRQRVMGCTECDRPSNHDFYVGGGGFHWMFPRFSTYRPVNRTRKIVRNQYPHNTIGIGAVLFGRCWSVRWKGSKHQGGRR